MCDHLNEPDNTFSFLHSVIDMKDQRIEELEGLIEDLKSDISRLEEYEWMYNELLD